MLELDSECYQRDRIRGTGYSIPSFMERAK